MNQFQQISKGYNSVFQYGKLSVGVVLPVENYAYSPIPSMQEHLERVHLIEKLGFKSLWVRDIPFHVPSFGDAGQLFDPFTYLGFLAGQTSKTSLGVASIALPLHQPVHIAKSAATLDQLSGGRFIMGVASGDRANEYPAIGLRYNNRAEMFREAFELIRKAKEQFPIYHSKHFGTLDGSVDILPKPISQKIPLLMTGYSQQTLKWNALQADGWMSYPRDIQHQKTSIAQWRSLIDAENIRNKPFMQPLYVDLHNKPDYKPSPIHLGIKVGSKYLTDYLLKLKAIGVNHVALNLRFNHKNIKETLEEIAETTLAIVHT